MRKGELCGLLWKDVDLGEGTVARLGHAKTSITSDIYAHVLPGTQQQTAAILGTLLATKSNL